jgi:hypothetical protein
MSKLNGSARHSAVSAAVSGGARDARGTGHVWLNDDESGGCGFCLYQTAHGGPRNSNGSNGKERTAEALVGWAVLTAGALV